MRRTASLVFTVAAAAILVGVSAASAQNQVATHIGHVTDNWRDTPNGVGLLQIAIEEAEVAAQHAALAANDLGNLAAMQQHTLHVLHAVDADQVGTGPGADYGVRRGAQGTARHIMAAANTPGASDSVKTHATHVAAAANNTVTRVTQIVNLATRIARSNAVDEVALWVTEMNFLAQALIPGADLDGDGSVGWDGGEGGLEIAMAHANIIKRGEGL